MSIYIIGNSKYTSCTCDNNQSKKWKKQQGACTIDIMIKLRLKYPNRMKTLRGCTIGVCG